MMLPIFQRAEKIYDKFKSSHIYEFSSLTRSRIPDNTSGVYAIYNKGTMETLYVGKTMNLRRRLYGDHLMGSLANARLKKYMINDKECFPEIRDIDTAKLFNLLLLKIIVKEDILKV